jgi:hypothetical protein
MSQGPGVESEEDVGTTVTLTLPAAPRTAPAPTTTLPH